MLYIPSYIHHARAEQGPLEVSVPQRHHLNYVQKPDRLRCRRVLRTDSWISFCFRQEIQADLS